ncbi:MAG: cytochrome c-type biogenesis protein CcmH [Gemmatimonadales bacterium]|nr:cytochrome c-type biogenesis protein CcmH [Gemmatimonadales bacterium]MBP6571524.1 cytochrome c-type biogenesis protein CcmH [Gemmatimonadales bacterium]MBP7621046.1 cytochrome c-type biogenesis protein CcmH [Gemmatimonadales bacterium]
MSTSRRHFLGLAVVSVGSAVLRPLAAQDTNRVAPQDTGTVRGDLLRDPDGVGQRRDTVTAIDNDAGIIAIERQLKCTCGCTLDIYTCRTTDFTCTYSPALHKEVVALVQEGKTPEEVVRFFIDREGEKMLMAPAAQGFNLAGYLVPGLGMLAAGLALAAYLSRRREVVAVSAAGGAPPMAPDADALARLKRALDEVDS